jgi:hypothetical protein
MQRMTRQNYLTLSSRLRKPQKAVPAAKFLSERRHHLSVRFIRKPAHLWIRWGPVWYQPKGRVRPTISITTIRRQKTEDCV